MVDYRFLRNTAITFVIANCVVLVLLMELPLLHKFAPLAERIRVYELMRTTVQRQEQFAQLGGKLTLCDNEQQVNALLMLEKQREYALGLRNVSNFKSAQHFFRNENYAQISQTALFELLQSMPKGGVLHAHDLALCSSEYLIQLTYRPNLWVCVAWPSGRYEQLRFARTQPPQSASAPTTASTEATALSSYVNVTEPACRWTLLEALRASHGADAVDSQLHAQLTLYPQQHYDDVSVVWQRFRGIFRFVSGLLTYAPVWREYIYRALTEFYADGVQYLEIRSTLPILYDLNGANYTILNTTAIMRSADLLFRETHPDWIGSKLIYAPSRNVDDARFLQYLGNALLLKSTFPDYFAGFDLVSHEDAGRPLRDFAHELLAVQTELNFYFHAGETNWYGASTDENLIDAVLLGTKRIGHGLALYKHPEVLHLVRQQNIAIEVNPISNQILQYIGDDMRNHPAVYLVARDYAVVIASDDPSFWKATPLTHDFYAAFMGIASRTADLAMLKQLAFNSIQHGSFDSYQRGEAMVKWMRRWTKWIQDVLEMQNVM